MKAKRSGRFKKGGIPDTNAAARGLLEDWNKWVYIFWKISVIYDISYYSGKIKYYTIPPEVDDSDAHISSAIVTEVAKEFNLDEFETMETEVLNKIEKDCGTVTNSFVIESTDPVESLEQMDEDQPESELV